MKKNKSFIVIIFLIVLVIFVQCEEPILDSSNVTNVLRVPQQYQTIQSAIDAADKGDTVLVSPGTYFENIHFIGKGIVVKADGSAETVAIDGSQPIEPEDASVVKFIPSGQEVVETLDGFTITGGRGSWSWPGKVGGGIWIENAQAVIKNCIIQNNLIIGNGGAPQKGGGVYCGYEMGTNLQSSILLNCVITNNVATSGGSGIYISTSGAMSIDHCTIANNDVMLETTAAATTSSFTSCIIWPATISKTNGTPAFNYCDIQGGWLSGVGNIDENPKFADVQLLDYRLASNSPCVGTGENGTNMGALGSCGIEYQVFKYPLTIGTTWTYKYDYDYSHLAWWEKRHGFHYWSVIDSIINNSDIISFKIQSINKDTVSSSSTPDPPTLIIDTTYFYIDRGFDIIIVRPPSSIPYMSIEDSIQGFFRSDQSFHLPPSPPYPPDYGRFYQEGLGLVRMRANQYTNTHYDELQQLTEFNGNPVFPKNK